MSADSPEGSPSRKGMSADTPKSREADPCSSMAVSDGLPMHRFDDSEKYEVALDALRKKKESAPLQDEECFSQCFMRTQALLQTVAQQEMDQEIAEQMSDDAAMDDWGKEKFGVEKFGQKFGAVITSFVILNALSIGIETDFAGKYSSVRAVLDILEHIYCTVFLVEMIIRIVVDYKDYFTNVMSVIDFVLVNFAVFDTWLLPLALGSGVGIGQLSMLRVIRLLRLVRLIKLMRSYKKLYLLVSGLIAGLKTLAWVALLMFITIYMFAIFCVQTIGHDPNFSAEVWEEKYPDSEFSSEKYFVNIFTAMITMWECLNDGCTHDVVRPIVSDRWYFLPLFLAFVFLMIYGFLNILVGVFCDSITESAEEQEEMFKRQEEIGSGSWEKHIRTLWTAFNTDSNGEISRAEFFNAFEKECMRDLLTQIQLGNVEADELFSTLDVNNDGTIWREELVEGVMKFKSGLKNPEVTTFMIKKRTEAEFSRCMALVDQFGELLAERNLIDNYKKAIKVEDSIDDLPIDEPEESKEEAAEPAQSPMVRQALHQIEGNIEGKWNLRFSCPNMEEKYLQSLMPQKLVCLKVSIVVQIGETISRTVFDNADLSPGANALRAAFSAACTVGTLLIAILLHRCLKNDTPWPLRWNVQRVLTACSMVKLIGSVLLRPCRLAVALAFELADSNCTPNLWWELVLLLYTVLGTWLPSRFQNQLLTTSLVARVLMLLCLDMGLLAMGVDALSYFQEEFVPVGAISILLCLSCYAFDVERRRAFLMRHCLEKQQEREQKHAELKARLGIKSPAKRQNAEVEEQKLGPLANKEEGGVEKEKLDPPANEEVEDERGGEDREGGE